MDSNPTVLKLDARFPVVWRTPNDLQVGVDVPLVRLGPVSAPEERMLHALGTGVSMEGLRMIGQRSRGGSRSAAGLLERLAPVLLDPDDGSFVSGVPLAGHAVEITGGSGAAGAVRRFLSELGAEPGAGAGAAARMVGGSRAQAGAAEVRTASPPIELAVIVSTWSTPPVEAASWLRRDIPHFDVVFSDSEVRVGPLVTPGHGPCLHCRERHRIDVDPAWPAIAGQLYGRPAPTELPLTIARVLPIVADFCLRALRASHCRTEDDPLGRAVHLDAQTGALSARVVPVHPACACRALPEIGMVREPASDSLPSPPTTAPTGSAPG